MSLNLLKREIYEYIRIHGEVTLDELCEAMDADANRVYGAAKHLKWDGYLDTDTGNNVWQAVVGIPGLCPECGAEAEWGDGVQEVCPECGWEETWTCSTCGAEEHDAIEVMDDEIEVDVTCKSVYFTFTDGTTPGMVFDHDEFERVIEHYRTK